MFTKDYDGSLMEIPQNKMKVTHQEAKQMFENHSKNGKSAVMLPKESNLEVFETMKEQVNEYERNMN
jgi:hypothetical protein